MKSVVLILCTFINLLHLAQAGEPVSFVTSSYEPYVIESDHVASGIFPDIVKAALHERQMDVKFEFLPWKSCENIVREGSVFATFPYIINVQRAKFFDFSDPVIYFFPKFFYKKENFPDGFIWKDLRSFRPYQIGGVLGYWYEISFKNEGLNVHYVTTDIQNIYKLMRGRIDFTLIDELVGWRIIKKVYPKQKLAFAVSKRPESYSAFHLMVSRKYSNAKTLTKIFNKGLKKIKKNGTYQKIFRKYDVPMEYATSW